ncbi:ferric reductase NAD binding domain-containing protein [Bombardia bombarda]|uniref:Ferric reductase NAD binding domain-containing protein n=1 Tax=Bombardia bombarda TaxID=252184 RepID=A0AA39WGL9_9PEZI|nr:ferric reductase NAD binding domain-containing protein [Bombardia bombarda]
MSELVGRATPSSAYFAARQIVNEKQAKMYAAGLGGLIAVFVVFHWTRWLCVKLARAWKPAAVMERPFILVTRLTRNVLVRKVPGFKSAGHALLVAAYVAINAAATFTNLNTSTMSNFANRFGWMAYANMAFVVFLALKNTPLAFLTAYSYERLNCLHHVAGYTMFVYLVLHGALYTAYFQTKGTLVQQYSEHSDIAAIVCGFAFLTVIFSAVFIRRIWYELFYVIHIGAWIVGIVTLGLHQPDMSKKLLIIAIFTASMWVLDRAIRATRVLYYSINNEATLYPLANGGTKVVLKKAPARAEPGKHCFIWIPAIRKFETHPFTIHKGEPLEFTVKAHNGFTSDLHKYALANPGVAIRASADGPYGTFPDPMEFDKIVLIAGGGGATFTFGLAENILERMDSDALKKIVFIWSVKKHENLSWFREHLDALKSHEHSPKVNVSLYVTRAPSSPSDSPHGSGTNLESSQSRSSQSSVGGSSTPTMPPSHSDAEKSMPQLPQPTHHLERELERAMGSHTDHKEATIRKEGETTLTSHSSYGDHAIKPGRPDVASLIREAVTSTPANQRVLVAACGPDGLMRVVRNTTAKLIRGDGPAVELHCEQFDW